VIPEFVASGISKVIPNRLRPSVSKSRALFRDLKTTAKARLYSGSEYQCQFCNRSFRKLLHTGSHSPTLVAHKVIPSGYRKNARCPNCGSLDRERHIHLYLKNKAKVYDDARMRLLHFAPEENLKEALTTCSGIDYVSVDLLRNAMTRMDIANLGFMDRTFDAIICSHVLEHVPDDRRALSELFRVLKPGGWAVIQVPISFALEVTYEDPTIIKPVERHRAFGQRDHLRIYGKDYLNRLRDAGFDVDVWSYAEEFSEAEAHKHGLLEGEKLFVCRRPSGRLG